MGGDGLPARSAVSVEESAGAAVVALGGVRFLAKMSMNIGVMKYILVRLRGGDSWWASTDSMARVGRRSTSLSSNKLC